MKKLFETSKFNNIETRNRFMRSGTWVALAKDGFVTEELVNYYTKLANADLGMVTIGYAQVNEFEKANHNMIGLYDDKFIEGLKTLVKPFKESNTPVGIQLAMGGAQISNTVDIDWKIKAPSPVEMRHRDSFGNKKTYHVEEMTHDEIKQSIEDFANAALRVKKAGFDYVQLHAGHGYFLSSWLNNEKNTRDDEYGEDKTKYIIDLYKAVKAKVGDDYPITIKINSEEKVEDFSNHDLILELCIQLDKLGISLIDVSGNMPSRIKLNNTNQSYFKEFAKTLVQNVDCAVALTGGNKSFNLIEEVLNYTNVDFIGLSRTLVSESDLILKWQEDETYEPRCISCNHCHKYVNLCVFDK